MRYCWCSQVNSSRVKSSQVKSSQVKSSQVVGLATRLRGHHRDPQLFSDSYGLALEEKIVGMHSYQYLFHQEISPILLDDTRIYLDVP